MLIRKILVELLDRLWTDYCNRVSYARQYRDRVVAEGGKFANDHLAFRTFNTRTGQQPSGIEAIARMITPLGYEAAGAYEFTNERLTARHYQHEDRLLPKILVSQLEVSELPGEARRLIDESVADAHNLLDTDTQARLRFPETMLQDAQEGLVDRLFAYVTRRPWSPPRRDVLTEISQASPYAAWTLLHGNRVHHFAALVNEHTVRDWADLDAAAEALAAAGVPMKAIEGERGSKLRCVATEAVEEDTEICELNGRPGRIRWPYSGFELVERGEVPGPDGNMVRFEGFVGPQAGSLFEAARR